MDAPAQFPDDFTMAKGTYEQCLYKIPMEGNFARCKISWMGDIIQVVAGKHRPCSNVDRAKYLRDLDNTMNHDGCPLFIFKDCPGCNASSVMSHAIDLGCDKSTEILACLLKRFAACNLDAAQLLDDPILFILRDERSIDFPQNRLGMDAACKLFCLMKAATGNHGPRPFDVGIWVFDIFTKAAIMPVSILALLGLLELTFQLFSGEKAAEHRKIKNRRVWGAVLQILWQHPRVTMGTMGYIVQTTVKLLEIERELLNEEHEAGIPGMSQVPLLGRTLFELQNESGYRKVTDLLRFCQQQPPPISFATDIQRTDDIHVRIRDFCAAGNPLDRFLCGQVREAHLWLLERELEDSVSTQNGEDVSQMSTATNPDVKGE